MRSCTVGEAVFISSRNAMLDETKKDAWETGQVLDCRNLERWDITFSISVASVVSRSSFRWLHVDVAITEL